LNKKLKRQLAALLLVLCIITISAATLVLAYAESITNAVTGLITKTEEERGVAVTGMEKGLVALCAALAVIASTTASAMALRIVASAGFAASAERPELSSYLLILGGLAEGIAIYGLLVAILLIGKI